MFRNLHIIYKINTANRINSLLYFFKKLPFLKKRLKATNYSFLKIKGALGFISIVYNLVASLVKSLFIFLILINLPSTLIVDDKPHLAVATMIFFFYFLFRLTTPEIVSYEYRKIIMVKQMKMTARDFSLADIFPNELVKFVSKVLVFSLFLIFSPFPLYGLVLALAISGMNLFSEALHLYLYKKYRVSLSKHTVVLVFLYLFIWILGYGLALISPLPIFYNILVNPIFLGFFILLGLVAGIYIYRYDYFSRAINESNNIEYVKKMQADVKDIHFGGVKLKEKDFKGLDLSQDKFAHKSGYNYLNSIFFDRHKRFVYKPMIYKSLFILGAFVVFFIVDRVFSSMGIGFKFFDFSYKNFNFLVFIMYLLCNSERLIKSMFYNCDLFLLRYGFYKKGDALLKMFFLRLLRIMYSNLLPATVLALGLGFSISHFTFYYFKDTLPIILLIYALAMFFSVHYIFMYYIFQPFTSTLEIKNPFYKLINFVVYFISYMLIQISAPPLVFLPIIIGLLILYILIAIILVYKRSPKTFRIK